MTSRSSDPYCACGHPQSFHAGGHGLCRCGCEAVRLRGRAATIEILGLVDPGDPPRKAPTWRVRCPRCGNAYKTVAYRRQLVTRRSCRSCADARKTRGASGTKNLLRAGRYDHGQRACYAAGCRCPACREANCAYERGRGKARRAGTWDGLVSAAPARRHLLRLTELGIGRDTVSDITGIGVTSLGEIRRGERRRVRRSVAAKILAVTRDATNDAKLVDGAPTQRLIAKLLEQGFTRTELARRLGSTAKTPALQLKTDRLTARNAHKVERLYRELMT